MDYREIIFLSILGIATSHTISNNQNINNLNLRPYNLNLQYEKNIDETKKEDFFKGKPFIETYNNGIRKQLNSELTLNKIIQSKIYPNQEPNIIVEEFFGEDNLRYSKVTEEIENLDIPNDYWQDTKYFLRDKLIYTTRTINQASRNNNLLEGRLINNSNIITKSGEEYILTNNNGYFEYKLKK